MIVDFYDKTTEDIFHGNASKHARKIPNTIWSIACRKLDMLNAAQKIADLKEPSNNRLKQLKGKLKSYYSIRVNDQYRIIFHWIDGNASSVQIIDYH
jgi:proteic killer suppression protein